jgi:hypothetical protein
MTTNVMCTNGERNSFVFRASSYGTQSIICVDIFGWYHASLKIVDYVLKQLVIYSSIVMYLQSFFKNENIMNMVDITKWGPTKIQ